MPRSSAGSFARRPDALGWAAWLLVLAAAGDVRAAAAEASTAEVLFREARELIARGDYAAACPKLEESQRLDPAPGTEFNLARCYELVGRFASAWGAYVDVASVTHAAGQSDREALARERAALVEPRVSYVTVTMQPPASGETRLTRDGIDMASAQLEVPIPVDPGEHVLRATAPGKRDWETRFRVEHDSEHLTVEVPPLEDAPLPPAPAATPAPAEPPPPAAPPVVVHAPSGTGQRMVAITLFGASAVALGMGIYFGIDKYSLASQAWNDCPHGSCPPNSPGLKAAADSNNQGNWSTGSFIAFGLLAATGGIVWFTAPKDAPSRVSRMMLAPSLGPSGVGATLHGEFE